METLWDGECLDENGEIQALELYKLLNEKYGLQRLLVILFSEDCLKKEQLQDVIPNIL